MNDMIKNEIFGCIYRHPKAATSDFTDSLCELMATYINSNIPICFLGDININISNTENPNVLQYANMLSSLGYKNFINVPTRFAARSRSILDHVTSNLDEDMLVSGVLDSPISDHLHISISIKISMIW